MKIKAKLEYKIPTCLLSAIVYSDYSGLNEEDEKSLTKLDREVEKEVLKYKGLHGTWDFSDEEYFTWRADFTDLGCNVVDATLNIF